MIEFSVLQKKTVSRCGKIGVLVDCIFKNWGFVYNFLLWEKIWENLGIFFYKTKPLSQLESCKMHISILVEKISFDEVFRIDMRIVSI